MWLTGHLGTISLARIKSEKNIKFYEKDIKGIVNDLRRLHINAQDMKVFNKLQHAFKYYKLSVYLYAYASFAAVLLGKNYNKDYLDDMTKKINEHSYQYQLMYSDCYPILEDYLNASLDAKALKGVGSVSKTIGSAVAKIPVIEKGPVDEALIKAGKALNYHGNRQAKDAMHEFRKNRDAGTGIFVENIEIINTLCNEPVELMFDDNVIYLCA